MSIERDNGKRRLQRPKLRDVSRPSSADRGTASNAARPFKTANRSLIAMARRAAAKALGSAGSDAIAAPEAAQLVQEAMCLFRAFVVEIDSRSPTARAHALSFALQTMAAQQLTLAAAEVGLATERGAQLLEQAARCQGRAERSAIAAITLAGLLDRRTPSDANAALTRILGAGAKEPTP